MNRFVHSTRRVRTAALILTAAVAVATLGSCGDAAATMPVEEWVAEFDQLCAEIVAASTPELSEAEFKELSDAGLAEMRALPDPDEHAAEADAMLASIEATTDPAVAEVWVVSRRRSLNRRLALDADEVRFLVGTYDYAA